jgi:hypothetical protein
LIEVRYGRSTRYRLSAGSAYLIHHILSGRPGFAFPANVAPQIVHHDFGAAAREQERMRASKTFAGTGDYCDPILQIDWH